VRIGTWNLEGRWDARHEDHLTVMRCDLLLLTEVSERVKIPDMTLHATRGVDGGPASVGGGGVTAAADTVAGSAWGDRDGRARRAAGVLLDPAVAVLRDQ
jgi:hypothetical protein